MPRKDILDLIANFISVQQQRHCLFQLRSLSGHSWHEVNLRKVGGAQSNEFRIPSADILIVYQSFPQTQFKVFHRPCTRTKARGERSFDAASWRFIYDTSGRAPSLMQQIHVSVCIYTNFKGLITQNKCYYYSSILEAWYCIFQVHSDGRRSLRRSPWHLRYYCSIATSALIDGNA